MNPLVIVIIVVVVAIIALTVVYLIQRKKKKRAEALAAESDEPPAPGDDEVINLVRDAEAKLAAAKIEGAKAANLPVYLVVGDPSCAKTSVMLHSGLDPELVAGQVYQQGNVAPTRSANIWFSHRSLFVEAGGALLAEPAKWKKLVTRLRPKASVVGKGEQAPRAAIVCFDCENFTKPGALEAAAASARTLRSRLGDVCQSFGIKLPVYVVFTKMDRLPFFTDYVRNLSNDEATQVLGVTLPMAGARAEGVYAEEETARLTGSFEGIFRSLADARIEFLPRETEAAKLPAEYEFPREFRKIRQTIVQFLVDLCRPSQLTTGPFLRGFYFSGVRPIIINESAPVQASAQQQANFGTAAGATGIFSVGGRQPSPVVQQPVVTGTRKVPQWMFLGHFFNSVLLADRTAAGASVSSVKTSGSRRILLGIAAGLCALLLICFTISFFKNRGLENQVADAAHAIGSGEAVGADFASVDSLRKLDTLRQSVETLSAYHRDGAPFMYRWFLYIGDDLFPEARRVYFARFKQLLFNQTQGNDLAFLQGLPASPGPDYQPTYDALKAYLITTSNHDKSTKLFLSPEMMKLWQTGRNADPDRQALAQKQFDFYADELKDQNPFSSENDAAAVEKSRRYLANFAGAERVYAFMLSEANKNNPPVNFNKQYPGSEKSVVDAHEVPGAFSKSGWAYMKDALAHVDRYFNGEQWVLGNYATANIDRNKLASDLQARYYSDFENQWRAYIKAGNVLRYASLKDASTKLQQLSGNQSPLLELISLASNNTDVDDPTVKAVFQPVQAVVPPGSDKFVAPPNQNYMNTLIALQTSIDGIADQAGQPSEQAAAPSIANANQATSTARQLAQTFRPDPTGHIDAGTQKLLEDPITYVLGLIRLLGPAELNGKGKDLCAQVRPLMAKYPFNPNPAAAQATLADFNTIFDPKKGLLWVFYSANLQKLLQRQGSTFVPVAGAGMTMNPSFVAMMNRAGAFTDVAYANGATDPHFTYTVKPVMDSNQDSIKMTIDGQTVEFTAANQTPKQFVWPSATNGTQASVTYKGGTPQSYPTYDGLWGVFQFVQDADKHSGPLVEMILKAGKQGKPVTDPKTGQPITLQFDINANPPIFDKGYFSGMACVQDVVKDK